MNPVSDSPRYLLTRNDLAVLHRERLIRHGLTSGALPILAFSLLGFGGQAKANPGTSAALFANPPYTCAANYYVATNGSDNNGDGSSAHPWLTITNAEFLSEHGNFPTQGAGQIPPGTCINVGPGTYSIQPASAGYRYTQGGQAETDGQWSQAVIYRSVQLRKALLVPSTSQDTTMFLVGGNYFVFDGFDMSGSYMGATTNASTEGVNAGGCGQNAVSSHVLIINNYIHDMGSAGISVCADDYISIISNEVYNTSYYDPNQVSGIDITWPQALVANEGVSNPQSLSDFQIVVLNNLVHGNGEGSSIPAPHSDGNGIIIDTTRGNGGANNSIPSQQQACVSQPAGAPCDPYTGNILVMGNATYDNGGGGVHVFKSNNTWVVQNTSYDNYLDQLDPAGSRAELSAIGSVNVTFVDNIAFALAGTNTQNNQNLIYNAPVAEYAEVNLYENYPDSGEPNSIGVTWVNNLAWMTGPGGSSDSGWDGTGNSYPECNNSAYGAITSIVCGLPGPLVFPNGNPQIGNFLIEAPQLVNPPKYQFKPQSGSPVVNGVGSTPMTYPFISGTNISAYTN